ncbi:MAG: alkaline phosphatase family protein [Armatimonadetes bacterium]|nr:alkaline phosphatase family protein [Armatimonadota bacterium]MCX7967528.1 alkaline phosphatase family protein [Armatimonadota bacterium]MDW8142953.1 alkaline phosphatase family protein [Armatimonadota bacterium]
MKRRFVLSLAILLASTAILWSQVDRTVVIISWDGGKPSVIRQMVREARLPNIQRLMVEGSYSWTAQTIVPSSTLQSHTSMVTGVTMQKHGVTWNDKFREEEGFVKVPTIFELAKKAGLKTAMVVSKSKLKQFAKPGTLDAEEYVRGDALKVAEVAVKVIEQVKPNLMLVHFSDPDSAGHSYGWGNEKKGIPPSQEFLNAVKRCDKATGEIVNALKRNGRWEKALVIITADHGGHDKTHGSSDLEDVNIPWIAAGGLAAKKGELQGQIKTMDTAATALAALGIKAPNDWDGKPVWEALGERGEVSMNGKQLPIIAEWKGNHSGVTEPKRIVITNAREWEELWKQVHKGKILIPNIPTVDFNKNMVVAAFMGQKPTSGYAIQITEVTHSNGEIVVKLKETKPPKGAIVLQVLTQPFHIVVVSKVEGKVRFVE